MVSIVKTHVDALCSHMRNIYFMRDLVPCHISKRATCGTFLGCNGIPVLECPGISPERNSIENVWNIMKKEIGNQML